MKNLLYLFTFFSIVSCDCYKIAAGKVVDKNTTLPIQGVKVCFYDQPSTFAYTDSLGNYSIHYVQWGIGCYTKDNKKVIAEKNTYKKSDVVPTMDIIELEKEIELQKLEKKSILKIDTKTKNDSIDGMHVYTHVEKMPEYPGGDEKLFEYIFKNYKIDNNCKTNKSHPPGKIVISFIIDTNGNTREVNLIKGFDCIEKKFIKNMSNWIPGEQNGTKVPVKMILPIYINWK